jgi:hypothetical protein
MLSVERLKNLLRYFPASVLVAVHFLNSIDRTL